MWTERANFAAARPGRRMQCCARLRRLCIDDSSDTRERLGYIGTYGCHAMLQTLLLLSLFSCIFLFVSWLRFLAATIRSASALLLLAFRLCSLPLLAASGRFWPLRRFWPLLRGAIVGSASAPLLYSRLKRFGVVAPSLLLRRVVGSASYRRFAAASRRGCVGLLLRFRVVSARRGCVGSRLHAEALPGGFAASHPPHLLLLL